MPIKLITIITDGKSNVGGNPVDAAKEAREAGIIVNAIGIMGHDEDGSKEVIEIAKAGGGIYDLTQIEYLSKTMQAMTQKSVQMTIEQIVNTQIKQIVGSDIKNINPAIRSQIADYIDSLTDKSDIEMVILMDTSGSMYYKIKSAKESVVELLKTLSGRKGKSSLALVQFPGSNGMTNLLCDFTEDPKSVQEIVASIGVSGYTPTAAAIREAISMLTNQPVLNEYIL